MNTIKIADELMALIKDKFGEELNNISSMTAEILKRDLVEWHNNREDNRENGILFEEYGNVAIMEECGDHWDVMTKSDYEKLGIEPDKMFIATLYDRTKIYDVDMDSFGWVADDTEEGEGCEVYEEESLENNTPALSYWDGNNWKLDFLQAEPEEVEYKMCEEQTVDPCPAYYDIMKVLISGEEVELVSSNTSGRITPYWVENTE